MKKDVFKTSRERALVSGSVNSHAGLCLISWLNIPTMLEAPDFWVTFQSYRIENLLVLDNEFYTNRSGRTPACVKGTLEEGFSKKDF